MTGSGPEGLHDVAGLRRLLHGVNDELSIAMLQLEVLVEEAPLDGSVRSSIDESLAACKAAAVALREVWSVLDRDAASR